MNATIADINLSTTVAALVISLVGLIQTLAGKHFELATRRFLTLAFAFLVAYDASVLLQYACMGRTSDLWPLAYSFALFFQSVVSMAPSVVLTAFVLHASGVSNWRGNPAFVASMALTVFYLALLVWTQYSHELYFVDTNAVYRRGPLYPLLLVPPASIMLLNLITLFYYRNRIRLRLYVAFLLSILLPTIALIWQMFNFGLFSVMIGSALGAFVMFSCALVDQTEQYYQLEAEIARLRTDVMLAQIQPHFLRNTLESVGRLCQGNPEAQDAIAKTSRYLQENVDALSREVVASFEHELLHVKTYLELEQLHFGDAINVVYQIGCTDFLLPTLTLQPLVENAVEHGIRGTEDGRGTVTIASHEYEHHWDVVIKDDGCGFDPPASLEKHGTHVGLVNVAERLRFSCMGELIVESARGEGTTVTMRIPRLRLKRKQ
ncbi:MAG: histidine kinase [Coriobacteriales bacterium]|nr:histidine kinase [Coriobacteriales bacterium]